MKFISDNLLVIALAFLVGISPIQAATSSVSKCMNMSTNIHQQMNVSDGFSQADNTKSDCCNKNICASTNCANASVAALTSNNITGISYTVSSMIPVSTNSLIQSYPSSLYRPPKI